MPLSLSCWGAAWGPLQPPTARAWYWAMRRGRTAAAPAPCTSASGVRRQAHSAPAARRVNPSRHARGGGGGTAAAGHRLQRLNAARGGGLRGGNTLSAAVAAAHVRGGCRWRRRTRTCPCNHRGQLGAGWGPRRQRGMPAVAAPRRVAVRGGGGGHCPTVSSLPMRHQVIDTYIFRGPPHPMLWGLSPVDLFADQTTSSPSSL